MTKMEEERRSRLIEVRNSLGFSQKEFAHALNISPAHICALEAGNRRVTDRLLQMLALTFGANSRWLNTGEGKIFDDFEDARLCRVTENFKKLDTYLQDYIIKQIDFVLEIQDKLDNGTSK
ncbi:MAG: helix-turn-helix transcriptional regulator [Spirochaetaceae bacterium]|jgi:transcriptional regulator with XRE-family HTH domain|nr:helix-turn-helix transcriptional regulator [Spirochaetaceae bacterium]